MQIKLYKGVPILAHANLSLVSSRILKGLNTSKKGIFRMDASMKAVKPTVERISESMTILNKLQELGISNTDPGYKELSGHFNIWIKGGDTWIGYVDFYRWNRRAKVLLPIKTGAIAKCDFLHHVF